MSKNNRLTAIIAAVGYDDILDITLSENSDKIDDIIVVTDTADVKITDVCKKFPNVTVCHTNAFYANGSKFNRGLAYNLIMDWRMDTLDWVLLLDADIVLPSDFRGKMILSDFDTECFYGCRRRDIQTYKDWEKVKNDKSALNSYTLFRGIGYGFFQLFNTHSSVIRSYVSRGDKMIYPPMPTVSEGDWMFRNLWSDWIYDPILTDSPESHNIPNNDRALHPHNLKQLPFDVIHLGITGKQGIVGEDGSLRITPRFN